MYENFITLEIRYRNSSTGWKILRLKRLLYKDMTQLEDLKEAVFKTNY
jgi:hypothetical protein